MWKKDETPEPAPFTRPEPPSTPVRMPAPVDAPNQRATIGSSITIRGDVTGDEDLLIQGRVEGSVDLKQHAVTVGREGQVKADISGRVIAVEGRVEGNLKADEQVILRGSAVVQGDIQAPRVVLEDGARFRGGVDMGEPLPPPAGRGAGARGPEATRASAPVAEAPLRTETREAGGPEKSAAPGKPDGAARPAIELRS